VIMNTEYIFSGIFLIILGGVLYNSVLNDSPLDAHSLCRFEVFQPCEERMDLLLKLSYALFGIGVISIIYGVIAPSKVKQEVVVHTRVITEHDEKVQPKPKHTEDEPKVFIRCPKCGRLNDPDSMFCKWCGTRLIPESQSEQR